MPEGDTIHYAATKIRPVLQGHVPDSIETPHPRFGRDRWPEKLAGSAVRSVDAHGKNLFIRFDNGLTIHSHLRMTGKWRTRPGDWHTPRNTWLILRRGLKQMALGLGIGLVAAFFLANVMRTLLVHVSPSDPVTFAAISFGRMAGATGS